MCGPWLPVTPCPLSLPPAPEVLPAQRSGNFCPTLAVQELPKGEQSLLCTGISMSAAQAGPAGHLGTGQLPSRDTDGHPGNVPPPPRARAASCRVMEAQEHLPTILTPLSRAGQAALMALSQPLSPALSLSPLPPAPWPCQRLSPRSGNPSVPWGGGREECHPSVGFPSPVSPGSEPPPVSGGSVGSCQPG